MNRRYRTIALVGLAAVCSIMTCAANGQRRANQDDTATENITISSQNWHRVDQYINNDGVRIFIAIADIQPLDERRVSLLEYFALSSFNEGEGGVSRKIIDCTHLTLQDIAVDPSPSGDIAHLAGPAGEVQTTDSGTFGRFLIETVCYQVELTPVADVRAAANAWMSAQ